MSNSRPPAIQFRTQVNDVQGMTSAEDRHERWVVINPATRS